MQAILGLDFYAVPCNDPGVVALADRHYSRKHPGRGNWWSPAKTLALTNDERTILFAWQAPRPEMRLDGQTGYNNIVFRNESNRLSSDCILLAESLVFEAWGVNRLYTYVDPTQVKSTNPGYCYLHAGWHKAGWSKSGKLLLVKEQTMSDKPQATLKPIPCWYCKGKGSLESKPRPFGTPMIMMSVNLPCTQCKGTGKKEGW